MEKLYKFLFILPITFIFTSAVLADNPGEEESSDDVVTEEVTESSEEVETVDSTPVEESGEDVSSDADDEVVTLEKVTVTGSRIKRSQVEGATPLIVISKQDMKDNGYRNLTEALQSLPIANGFTQNEALVNTFTPNASELDLRRFGPGRVLVLVNGRRMADYPFPYNNSSNFVNTGTIPAGLVDRVEILTSGSSAIYGSDAVTGVVNIITTQGKDFSEVDVSVGQTDNGGDNILDLTFSTGGFSGNHSWTVGANLYHIDPMYYNDRPGFSSWEDNPIWSDPKDPLYQSDAVFADVIVGLQTRTGRNIATGSGLAEIGLDAVTANGYSCEDIYPTAFAWNKADYGYTSPPYSYPGSYCVQDYGDDLRTLINERDEGTVMGTYSYNFDNGIKLDARAFYYESESMLNSFSRWFRASDVWSESPVPVYDAAAGGYIGDPNVNKFTYLRTFGGQLGPNSRRESNYKEDVADLFVGLSGMTQGGYDWQLGVSKTEYNSEYTSNPLTTEVYDWIHGADRGDTMSLDGVYQWYADLYNNFGDLYLSLSADPEDIYGYYGGLYKFFGGLYAQQIGQARWQAHPCGTRIPDPVFGGTVGQSCLQWDRAFAPVNDSELANFNALEVTAAETSSTMIDFQITGETDYQLRGGPVAFALAVEAHQQDYLLKPDQRRIDSDNEVEGAVIFINGSARQGGGDRSRVSAGLELALPVTTKLDVTAALRTDSYDDESSAVGRRNSAMLNFAYRPNDKFLLRGSAGESFRAPDMHYVYAGSSSYFTGVTDVRACFEAGIATPSACDDYDLTIKGRFQGNTELAEESGENYSLGFVWDFAEGASFTLDAFHVKLEGAVENLDVQAIANREAFCINGDEFATWLNDANFNGVDCTETLAAVQRETTQVGQIGNDGALGDIEEITTYNRNQAFEEFVGVDTTLRYSFSTETRGDWRFVLYNSNILSRKFKGDETSDTIEILNAYLYEPRSQQTATTSWIYNDWSVSWYMDRLGHTEQFFGEKADPFITHNLGVRYNYSADLSLRASITNLEDKMPEKDSAYGFPYFNRGYYSIFGRAFYVSAQYRF